jgi:hypothetical protein
MENTDIKFDNVIGNLRRQKPVITDSDLLTESILKQIKLKSDQSKPLFLIWVRTVSSAAAVLLLGLFAFQQTITETVVTNYRPHAFAFKISINPECIRYAKSKPTTLAEIYSCYLRQNSIKNKRYQSYCQQLNESGHENNN